ncbi:uncharacterized protein LOC132639594 [Lycium barbarum]|uniref:uncharacterized protein LOC132639594 n=1 Tax=Lycium barbarum TaxID=112863 RepID=UPI00293E72D7|nr:uncharacterized protein LOC132639594 [Lycium barbarum]
MSATSPYDNLVRDDENMEATSKKNGQWDDSMALATVRMKDAVQTTKASNEKMKEAETLLAYVEELTKQYPANWVKRGIHLKAHLRAYCDQLVGNGGNEALFMRLFSRSLLGTAMEWFIIQDISRWKTWEEMASSFIERFCFNVENVPDRFSLEKFFQKSTETYREYASCWRDEAAHIQPPMIEAKFVAAFIRYQEADCFDKMITIKGSSFANLVAVGEDIEGGLKTGKIFSILNRSGASGAISGKKKKEDVAYVSGATSPKS